MQAPPSGLPPAPKLELLLEHVPDPSAFHALLAEPFIKSILPFPLLALIGYVLFRVLKGTWAELDREATAERMAAAERGEQDYRPALCLVLCAAILTIQEYYGGRAFYDTALKPTFQALESAGVRWLKVAKYDQLYGYTWWALSRVLGYVIVPVVVWKLCFRKDRILDYGLRSKGFFEHLWIYGVLLAIVLPVMVIVAQQPDFGSYYPFYKLSSRSWFDFLAWEAMYYLQFFALEFFFRGWMVEALRRSMGASAIFVMSLPYCMIHFGKPYLEAHGAIIAGVVLGTMSMKTRSIYAGFLLHVTVAAGMDFLSLFKRGALPHVFWGPG
jgi:membrane protease YdiL (CAAX protease family)